MGSTWVARKAGTSVAAIETAASTTVVTKNTHRSSELTWNKLLATNFVV
jgi:hypothetical protein